MSNGDAMKTTNEIQEAFNDAWENLKYEDENEEFCADEMDMFRAGWQAALTSKEAGDGWKWAPVEPTEEMLEAAGKHYEDESYTGNASTYRAMLAAAPQPQTHFEDVRGLAACVTCGQPVEQPEAVEPVATIHVAEDFGTGEEVHILDGDYEQMKKYPPGTKLFPLSTSASRVLKMAADEVARFFDDAESNETTRNLMNGILALIPPAESDQRKQPLEWDDEFTAKRLRRIAAKLGISVPESDEMLLACGGTVLGAIARHVDDLLEISPTEQQELGRNELVKHMVNRFLSWELPKEFAPDAGIRFEPSEMQNEGVHGWPSGTNLLHAGQAKELIQYMLDGLTSTPSQDTMTQGDYPLCASCSTWADCSASRNCVLHIRAIVAQHMPKEGK